MTLPETTIGDLRVTRIGFGAMRLCGPRIMGWPPDRENATAVLREVVTLGVTLIDTADAYGPAVNEEQIANALFPYPSDLVIATKGGNTRPDGRWVPDGRPEHLIASCEASLRRLRVDCIDLYQWHTPDKNVAFDNSVGALAKLRDDGKIRHVGLSNVSVSQLGRARGIVPIVAVQNRYNVVDREHEDVLEACAAEGIAFLAYFPIDAGDLANAGGVLASVARAHRATVPQIALAWLLAHSPAIVPIPGTSSVEHLRENVDSARIVLEPAEIAALDELGDGGDQ